jgi:alpha-1,3-mannosyltransferase
MKILQVVRQFLPGTGGMETYVMSLCRQLSRHGHRADVATLDHLFRDDQRLPPYQRIDGIDVIRFAAGGNARYFFAPRLMEALPRYDLIHIHGVDFFVDMLGTLKRLHQRPLVLSTHGGFFHTRWFPSLKKAYFNTITRNSLRGVDRVIASSPHDQQLFSGISGRVTLVENGIDYEHFSQVERRPSGDRLLFIGRLSLNKRVDRLVEILAELRKTRPEAELVIAGPDWEGLRSGLERQAAELGLEGSITFTGSVSREQLLELLSQARIFVSASGYEAFGLSTVEAMAAGMVVVVNRIQAFEDIISDGTDGFLADFSDSAGAARVISSALDMPDEELASMGLRARETAARYDWRRVVEGIIDIYRQVLAE